MTQEEKAKAYDMALEAARKELGVDRKEWEVVQQVLHNIFPELAESEDERTKRMLNTITYKMSQHQPDIFTEEENEWFYTYLEKQKEQKPVDKFQEYLNASPAERRKMNMDEILGDNKGHQKKSDALTTDSNKEADTSDCKYKNLDDIAQEYVDGVRQYNPEPTWDLMQTAVCYGYHLAENKQKPVEWSDTNELVFQDICKHLKEEGFGGWVVLLEALKNGEFNTIKQEWSEEDKKNLHWLCRIIHTKKCEGVITLKEETELGEWIDKWLNHGPQPKQEWSEEEKADIKDLIGYLQDTVHPLDFASEARFRQRMVERLKSLRPQPKQELDGKDLLYVQNKSYKIGFRDGKAEALKDMPKWSEEDENKIESIKCLITTGRFADQSTIQTIWNILDDLRPSWKPSEEQITGLYNMVCECRPADQQLLQDIYFGIKTLM